MQGKKQRERYRRLDRAERAAIQSGLDKGRSCRQMARDLGRSPSTVADEVALLTPMGNPPITPILHAD